MNGESRSLITDESVLSALTESNIMCALKILHDNGLSVQNSKKAYEELRQHQSNPSFCIVLSYLFGSDTSPVEEPHVQSRWIAYKQLAGITLKNNLEEAKHALGETVVREAARSSLHVLSNPIDARIARVAAQIVVKITALTSFEWWQSCGMGDLSGLLLSFLFEDELKAMAALYSLQYLMEDLPKQLGSGSKVIIERVVVVILNGNSPMSIRKAAFRMCSSMYEQASFLDWNVDELSPLQIGLTEASGTFASVCTALLEDFCGGDKVLMIDVFRSCSLMLDYLEYFTPMADAEMERLVSCWIINTISIVSSVEVQNVAETDVCLKTAAVDLLTSVLKLNTRLEGEGPSFLLVEPILKSLSTLIPGLVNFIPMSDEEIEIIRSSDNYWVRDMTAVNYNLNERTRDLSDDALPEDDRAAVTLRSSALSCIDALCVVAHKEAFSYLVTQAEALWGSSNQRLRETGIVLVGTISAGCHSEIQPLLPAIARQLVDTATSSSDDICVSSMAIWSLSRILDWAYTTEGSFLAEIMACFTTNLKSNSKRVQQAAVSALNTAFVTGHDLEYSTKLTGDLSRLTEAILSCLPIYCDSNLSLLCDLALHLISFAADSTAVSHIHEAFSANRKERAKAFETSYSDYYINEAPNIHVDKDIFSIDRVIVGFLTRFPDPTISLTILHWWQVVLVDITERDVRDDVDLVYNTIYMCGNMVAVTTSSALADWSNQTRRSLSCLAFQTLVKSNHQLVKVASVALLHRLLKSLEKSAFPDDMTDALFFTLGSCIPDTDDPYDKLELVRLITLMIRIYYEELTPNACAAYRAVADALRSDVYNETLLLYALMSFDVCDTLASVPSLVVYSRLEVVAQIMAQAVNSYEKSVATIRLVDALLSNEEIVRVTLPSMISLLSSWQQAVCTFPEVKERLSSLVMFYHTHHRPQLDEHLRTMSPNFYEIFMSTYGMSGTSENHWSQN